MRLFGEWRRPRTLMSASPRWVAAKLGVQPSAGPWLRAAIPPKSLTAVGSAYPKTEDAK